ncbi:RNA polymerase sigma factor [Persicitalea sp.]|uniref:RNA polymerase sigma factor n=1 Tax=Persicitalea sp. TaxID=3100273 RepID=UPI0035947A74
MPLSEEAECWDAFRAGDRAAFGQIYDQHIQELLSYGYRITSDRQLIRDNIQDLFLHLWSQRENLSPTDSKNEKADGVCSVVGPEKDPSPGVCDTYRLQR